MASPHAHFYGDAVTGRRGRQRRAILGVPLSGNGDLSEMTLGGDFKRLGFKHADGEERVMGDAWSVGGERNRGDPEVCV